jgi:hypothetical protein
MGPRRKKVNHREHAFKGDFGTLPPPLSLSLFFLVARR